MDETLAKFVVKHYIDSEIYTHVSLIEPKGKFQFNRDTLEKFWDLYCNLIHGDAKGKVISGIGEKFQYYLPVLCDIDLKVEEYNEEEDHVYTEQNLRDVIQAYQDTIRETVEDCRDEYLTCVVMEKDPYIKQDKNGMFVKNGLHLHFPYCFIGKKDLIKHFYPRVQKILKEKNTFINLCIEDSGSVLDIDACVNATWMSYGSRKTPDSDPYLVTKVINAHGKEIDLETAFHDYLIYDKNEEIISVKGKVEYYLPRILSVVPYGRDVLELKSNLEPLKKVIERDSDGKVKKKFSGTTTEQDLKVAKKLIPLLSLSRVNDYTDWMTIGWALYNIGDGSQEAFDLWNDFSSQGDTYDENKCMYEWERMVKKQLTIGTLKYYAKVDNPELYKEIQRQESREMIRTSLSCSHHDIAKLLYAEYGTEFVCGSISNKMWFQFKNHIWKPIEEGVFLRKLMSEDIVSLYIEEGARLFHEQGDNMDKAKDSSYQEKIKQVQKIISKLKDAPFKSNVMKEAAEIFYNETFKEKLNTNSHLIAFKNGVYDLKMHRFRKGRPEDYLSRQMPINYTEFTEDDPRVKMVHRFLEQVFCDKSLRTYFLDTTAEIFIGGNQRKLGLFWTGEGDNGKSVTQTVLEQMLGEYAIKATTSVLTGKKLNSGSADPDKARAGDGIRLFVFEESNKEEEINCGTYKSMTGNDTYSARDLFEKGKNLKEITPLFKVIFICNQLPKFKGGGDKATWNRTRVLPFETTFVRPGEPCPESYEEQLREKKFPMDLDFYSKIPLMLEPLAWVLLDHLKKGIVSPEPEKVRMATANYRKQNDLFRKYTEENITENKGYIYLQEINSNFREWIKEEFSGISNSSIPNKSEIREYFTKLWGYPEKGDKWYGYKIKTLQDEIDNGDAIVMTGDDFVDYSDNEE